MLVGRELAWFAASSVGEPWNGNIMRLAYQVVHTYIRINMKIVELKKHILTTQLTDFKYRLFPNV